MVANLSFPVHHLSMRVPWHDSGWNGVVCMDPVHNTACLKLKQIAENKDEASESSVAGTCLYGAPGKCPTALSARAVGLHESAWFSEQRSPPIPADGRGFPRSLPANPTELSLLLGTWHPIPMDVEGIDSGPPSSLSP